MYSSWNEPDGMEEPVQEKPDKNTKPEYRIDAQVPTHETLVELRGRLLRWFEINGREFPWRAPSVTTYQYVVAELLLQRTRAETVASFFLKFIKEFASWKQLESASTTKLQHHLKPVGLWRRRTASLQALSRAMVKRNGEFPRKRGEIEALPGIGQYIANSVLLFCYGIPEPLLDVNMARVLERVFGPRKLADIRYDPYLQKLAKNVVDCNKPLQLNWAILDLAATTCFIKNPRCSECPLSSLCLSAKTSDLDEHKVS